MGNGCFFTSALDGGRRHAPAVLPLVTIWSIRRLSGPQIHFGLSELVWTLWRREAYFIALNRTRTTQHATRHCYVQIITMLLNSIEVK